MSQLSFSGFLWFCASYRVAIECCSAVAALQAEVVGDLHIRVHPLHKDVPPGGKHLLALGRQDGLAGQSRFLPAAKPAGQGMIFGLSFFPGRFVQ